MDSDFFNHARAYVPTDTKTSLLARSTRCILATSDWALCLRSLVTMFGNWERQLRGDAIAASTESTVRSSYDSETHTREREIPVVYWILTSRSVMNQSNFADVASMPTGVDLNRINLKYRETLAEILQFGANLHVAYGSAYQPIVVVLHGLDKIADASHSTHRGAARSVPTPPRARGAHVTRNSNLFHVVEPMLCRALAVLRDGLEQHRKRTGSPYVLCASLWGEDAEKEPPGYYYIVKRWCDEKGLYVCGRDGVVRWAPGVDGRAG